MKAAVIKDKGVLVIEDVPTPQAGSGEVMVRVNYCGICGSDVRLLADGFFPLGLIPGHEFCGTISGLGPGVEGWVVGDRVTAMPGAMCGNCYYCLHGQRHHCPEIKIMGVSTELPGAFAEYVKVGADMLHRIPDEVTDEEAATVEPCAVSLRAVRLSGIQVGETAVVFGAGAIGLFALQHARVVGARAVYVVEPAQGRAGAALALGADRVFDPGQARIPGEVAKLTGVGADVAYVCTAAPPVLQQAVDSVRKQGRVMVVGGGMTAEVVPEYWMWKEVEVRGSYFYLDEFALAVELFRQRKITVEGMISEIIPLEKLPQAFKDLASPNTEIKVLVQPS
ncbi:MAG: alcohol dehydrogenase catalytic domain-containing protein [Chloroflexi bacterium]|nr:alcohol dehydrogenase catalytic domain-containing protein [Chloroflexota bacterium]